MSSLGEDIADVYKEIGAAIVLTKIDNTVVSGEFIDLRINAQATKPFIRSFFRDANFQFTSSGETGDLVTVPSTGEEFIIVHHTGEIFEDAVYEYASVLYKANIFSGEILRPSGEESWNAQTMRKEQRWDVVRDDVTALETESLFGNILEDTIELGDITLERDQLYIPEAYGIQELDRFQPSSGEYYRVETVTRRRFPNVNLCRLSEDTR